MQNNEERAPRYTENSLPERYDSWIKKVLRNLIQTEIRSYKRKKKNQLYIIVRDVDDERTYDPFEEGIPITVMCGSSPVELRNEQLAKCLAGMSGRKQQVIEGVFLSGISTRKLSEMLGVDEAVIRNYKKRGLDELRNGMEDDYDV